MNVTTRFMVYQVISLYFASTLNLETPLDNTFEENEESIEAPLLS